MALINPNNSTEILYGSSGDIRNEINAYASPSSAGHYVDETELPGSLIIRALERSTRRINTYLEVVYQDNIPVTSAVNVPVILDDISSDMATYYAWRANAARLRPMSEEKRKEYYEDHIREDKSNPGTLPMIRERKMQIPEFSSDDADETKAVRGLGQAPIFDVDSETNWGVDPNTLDDISDERSR